jgi:hypothetical protein
MVNWLPGSSNNRPVTRATTLSQREKLFHAPKPKPSNQTVPNPLLCLSLFLCPDLIHYPIHCFCLPPKHRSLPKNTKNDPVISGNAFFSVSTLMSPPEAPLLFLFNPQPSIAGNLQSWED